MFQLSQDTIVGPLFLWCVFVCVCPVELLLPLAHSDGNGINDGL